MEEMYRPEVSRHEDDDREGAEPGVSDGEEDVARDPWAREVPERENHHAHRQRQRDQIKHPHISLSLELCLSPSVSEARGGEQMTKEKRIRGCDRCEFFC